MNLQWGKVGHSHWFVTLHVTDQFFHTVFRGPFKLMHQSYDYRTGTLEKKYMDE